MQATLILGDIRLTVGTLDGLSFTVKASDHGSDAAVSFIEDEKLAFKDMLRLVAQFAVDEYAGATESVFILAQD